MNNINVERLYELGKDAKEIKQIIKAEEDKLKTFEAEAKKLLPKGYWYACDIDYRWHRPKKYSIREVSFGDNGTVYIKVKEVMKKKSWSGSDGIHLLSLNEFVNLKIYKTEEEALHRPCPKCGKHMMYSVDKWCFECMRNREIELNAFNENHKFYDPNKKGYYSVRYEDELTRKSNKGYNGQSFVLRRLDTGEIIHTTNLWADGYDKNNTYNLPEIEFLEGNA